MSRLLLVGGGHAHLGVLRELARKPIPGCEVHLVSPQPRQIYSGMLPGWISGQYSLSDIQLPLRRIAEGSGVQFHENAGIALDFAGNVLRCGDGEQIPFDAVSLDVGSGIAASFPLEGSSTAMPIRPLSRFVSTWPAVMERIGSQCTPFHLVIIGAGAAGVELAFAARHRGLREGWSHLHVTLVGGDAVPLDGAPERARRGVMKLLGQRCIRWQGSRRAMRVDGNHVEFGDGGSLPFDLCWVATEARAPQWLRSSGLAMDHEGFVRVNASLQSVSHPQVFAAGDVAAHSNTLPKSGVYAVRAGAPLAASLRAYCTGRPLPAWKPGRRALNLLSTSDQRAMALWGPWSWKGEWVWRWKDSIDRRFVREAGRKAATGGRW